MMVSVSGAASVPSHFPGSLRTTLNTRVHFQGESPCALAPPLLVANPTDKLDIVKNYSCHSFLNLIIV